MVPLGIIQCFTDQESMLFLRRYHICLIWALDTLAGRAHEPSGVGVYVELTMVPRTTPRHPATPHGPARAAGCRASLAIAFNMVYNVV